MNTNPSTYHSLSDYLFDVQAKGRFAITLEEIRKHIDASDKALLQSLYRLKNKNQLAQIRKGFYVIIPPQYSGRRMIPASLFIDDMMKYLGKDYYVGLFSAAALHGAGHQQPMEFQVMTKKPPLRDIENSKLVIRFFIKGNWDKEQITEIKTEAGYIHTSTPELTTFDLVQYGHKIGGLNRVIPILEELAEDIKPSLLVKAARGQKTPTIQRIGFLLRETGNKDLSNALYKIIEKENLREVSLSLAHTNRTGDVDKQWNVIINTELEL